MRDYKSHSALGIIPLLVLTVFMMPALLYISDYADSERQTNESIYSVAKQIRTIMHTYGQHAGFAWHRTVALYNASEVKKRYASRGVYYLDPLHQASAEVYLEELHFLTKKTLWFGVGFNNDVVSALQLLESHSEFRYVGFSLFGLLLLIGVGFMFVVITMMETWTVILATLLGVAFLAFLLHVIEYSMELGRQERSHQFDDMFSILECLPERRMAIFVSKVLGIRAPSFRLYFSS